MSVRCNHCGAVAGYGQEIGHKSDCPSLIVGHKTFSTGKICRTTGFPETRHEPLTKGEADALWARAEAEKRERTERMPDEQSAINAMWSAYQRLTELGWRDPSYCPKDGSHFKVIEPGSTGIHDGAYWGEWPNGHWNVFDGDVWPSRPVLFKLYPEDQAKEDERWRKAKERFQARATDTPGSGGGSSSAVETAGSSGEPTITTSHAEASSLSGREAEPSSPLSSNQRGTD